MVSYAAGRDVGGSRRRDRGCPRQVDDDWRTWETLGDKEERCTGKALTRDSRAVDVACLATRIIPKGNGISGGVVKHVTQRARWWYFPAGVAHRANYSVAAIGEGKLHAGCILSLRTSLNHPKGDRSASS